MFFLSFLGTCLFSNENIKKGGIAVSCLYMGVYSGHLVPSCSYLLHIEIWEALLLWTLQLVDELRINYVANSTAKPNRGVICEIHIVRLRISWWRCFEKYGNPVPMKDALVTLCSLYIYMNYSVPVEDRKEGSFLHQFFQIISWIEQEQYCSIMKEGKLLSLMLN